jgi:3-oxoacyl-[acyl-carrier protein] reductase
MEETSLNNKVPGKLEGKLAVVTGASRGLGRWIAVELAVHGAAVVVNFANSAADADETVRLITETGGTAKAIRADITQESEVERLIEDSVRWFGRSVDVLVNNATGPQPMLSIEESSWQIYTDQLEFFVKAPLLLTKAVLAGMKSQGSGSIVNIGSEVAQLGNANFSSYVTAKAAMIGMTRSWANELAPYGIRVNLVAPGWIPVERHKDSDTDGYQKQVPLQHMGEPLDIAAAVSFLASQEAKFITGQCLSVNGGNTFGI